MTAKVADISKQISGYLATQPVQRAWLFGSFARGEQREDSDIDILVAFDPSVGLFKYAAIYTDLKELLGREVDLVQEGALKPYAAATADRDKILIYERKLRKSREEELVHSSEMEQRRHSHPRRDKSLLGNMVESIDYALAFVEGYDYKAFVADKRTYFAVVKNMEIIGEAAYQLTNEFRDSHPQTPWKVIINMRHVLVHGYADIVPSVLWKTLKDDLLPLKEQLVYYLDNMT